MNRERIGALKICAGVYEAPHDQSFFLASDSFKKLDYIQSMKVDTGDILMSV